MPPRFRLPDDDDDDGDDDDEEEEAVPVLAEAQPMPMREATLRDILSSGFASPDAKLTPHALSLSSVLVRAFVEEARHRAETVALEESAVEVTDEHLEKVLPSLLLDFGP